MNEIDRLLTRFGEHIAIPWHTARSDTERTLFVIYDQNKERQLRYRIDEFRAKTEEAGKKWLLLDVTDSFAAWFANHDYRDEYLEHPEDLPGYSDGRLPEFEEHLAKELLARLSRDATTEHVVAVQGVGSLFGVARVSAMMKRIAAAVPGRLLIFFPGEKTDNNYRLLGARDGWDYLATAITAD